MFLQRKTTKVASEDEDMSEEDEKQQDNSDVDSDDSQRMSGDSDSDDDIIAKIRKERGGHVRSKKALQQTTIRSQPHERWTPKEKTKEGKRQLEMRTGTTNNSGRAVGVSKKDMRRSFGDRVATASRAKDGHRVSRTAMGGMEMSFQLQSKKKKESPSAGGGGPDRRQRRSASKNTFRGM